MKRILIPIDFTEVSNFGIDIAKKISKGEAMELHLLHVVTLPSHVLKDKNGELIDDAEFDLTELKSKYSTAVQQMESLKFQLNDFELKTCVCYGHVNEEVIKYEQKNSVDLIVMGTHGATGIKEYINGSHAEYVAMHAKAPVFTVKCDRSKMEIKSIAFTNSFSSKEIEFPKIIQDIQKSFNASIHLLRVNTSKSFMSDDKVLENMKYFSEQHNLQDAKYAVINDDEVESGIEKYCMHNSIDVISIGSKQRTGVNKLINGCVSADLVNHVFKPIITFKN